MPSRGDWLPSFEATTFPLMSSLRGRAVYDRLFRKADLILCVSESIRAKLLELGCQEQKIRVHHSGVDTRQFALPKRQPAGDGKVKLLTIARLVEKKGVRYGIQAVADAAKTHPCIEYRIVGDGLLRGELQNSSKNWAPAPESSCWAGSDRMRLCGSLRSQTSSWPRVSQVGMATKREFPMS